MAKHLYILAAYFLWWVPVALASIVLAGFSITTSTSYALAGLVILPLGGICAVTGIALVLVELNRNKNRAENVQRRLYRNGLFAIALLLLNFPLAGLFVWTAAGLEMEPAITQSLSLNRNQVAESYTLPENSELPYGNGVRLRPYWSLIRKRSAVTVFAARCQNDPSLSWVGENELLIECRRPKEVAIKKMRSGDTIIRYR